MKKNILTFFMASFICLQFGFSQNEVQSQIQNEYQSDNFDDSDDVIIVSGSAVEDDSAANQKTTQQVKIVSSQEIKESGAKNVSDVLRTVPEVTVNAQSSANATETISMQGLSSEYVKVLVDGIAVGTDIDGSTSVFNLPVEDIERIEVISGAGSVMYGSNAMGGVVNIITKKTKNEYDGIKFHFNLADEVSFSPATFNWRNYSSGGFSVAGENLSGNLSASYDYAPGKENTTWDALAGTIKYYESTKKTLAFIRASGEYKDDWGKIGAYGLFNDSYQIGNFTKTGYDKGSTLDYDTNRLEGGINGKYIFDSNLDFTAFSSVKTYNLDTTYEVKAGENSSSSTTKSNSLNWESDVRANWKIGNFNEAVFGLNAIFDTINGNSFTEQKSESQFSAFAQDTISLFDKKFQIVPGARFTFAPGNFGNSNSENQENVSEKNLMQAVPNLGFKFEPNKNTSLKLSYGMGYRIPSLRQKYWVFRHNYAPGSGNFILYGNPNLKAEKSHGINFSVNQNILNLFALSFSSYFNYINDLIDSVVTDATSNPQIREYQNVDKAITYGASVSASASLNNFDFKLGYAFTQAKSFNSTLGEWQDLALRSAHRITASASYLIPLIETKWSVNGEWNSPQVLSTGTSLKTPDYFMIASSLSKKFFDEKLEVYFRCDNLLNNLNFINGTNGDNQKTYYGLNDGRTFTLGARFGM